MAFNGAKTGNCGDSGYCEVSSWCPVEDKTSGRHVYLDGVESWSILLRIDTYFSKYNFRRTNTEADGIIPGYNAFNLSDIMARAEVRFADIRDRGCLIVADINFQCNLDYEPECAPVFKFTRLDDPDPNSFTTGFNFRYHRMVGTGGLTDFGGPSIRYLYKMYGVRIVFQVTGEARKFSLIALTTTLGAGLALLSVSSLVSDYFMVYLHPKKELYTDHKYEPVRSYRALEIPPEQEPLNRDGAQEPPVHNHNLQSE
eukprot:TRINITY_DN12591_c0_g1_i1.p1 TRINITY_DN12591_c0_g1~~TRINITY_DN12591_c0_g1_i1.p1  ORF type:complete len:256 (+),score=49.65 TRINITY_DN12591_c0_g1_i1:502-1269(+)